MLGRTPLYHTHRVRETVLFFFPGVAGLAGRPLLVMLTGLVAGILRGHAGLSGGDIAGVMIVLAGCGGILFPKRPLLVALLPLSALVGATLMAPWTRPPDPPLAQGAPQRTLTGRIEELHTDKDDLKCILRDVRFAAGPDYAPPLPVSA